MAVAHAEAAAHCVLICFQEVVPLRVELRLPVKMQQSGCTARFEVGRDTIFPLFALSVCISTLAISRPGL